MGYSVIFDVYPKINIFLKIVGSDARGYHFLDSRFCLARGALKDIIQIEEKDVFKLSGNFDCSMQDNTIYKAVQFLKKYLIQKNIESKILDYLQIEVEKNIPVGAGLGGGSADAGAILFHLNQKYFFLEKEEILQIAQQVGADVAFFVSNFYSANVSGVGEVVEEFKEKNLEFEIITPRVFCDTKRVYQEYDKMQELLKNQEKRDLKNFVQKMRQKTSKEILENMNRRDLNDLLLPALHLYPKLAEFEKTLDENWFFSGSGSSFFRIKDI
nr:4-(cytidine 5'-diphospho)-2-C-methyl-D-erythritol kinase [Helicobacter anatolicus]